LYETYNVKDLYMAEKGKSIVNLTAWTALSTAMNTNHFHHS